MPVTAFICAYVPEPIGVAIAIPVLLGSVLTDIYRFSKEKATRYGVARWVIGCWLLFGDDGG
jgi:hypothetical protein